LGKSPKGVPKFASFMRIRYSKTNQLIINKNKKGIHVGVTFMAIISGYLRFRCIISWA
jgi:hypothetical protein